MADDQISRCRELFFRQSGLPMAILDVDGLILDWNLAASATLGYSHQEAIGQSAFLISGQDDVRRLQLLLKRTVGESRVADFQTTVTTRDGDEIPVSMTVAPITDGGQVIAVSVVFRDQTRRIQLERRLAEEAKLAALGRLAGGLSHHVNNILAAVSAKVEMALATRSPSAGRQALRLTNESIDRLTNITRNLLLFAGAEGRSGACRPAAAAQPYLNHLKKELATGPVRLSMELADVPPVGLDAQNFQQLLQNLVRNARDAVAGDGTVTVTLAVEGHEVVLTVSDTGPGIPPDDLPHIFEPFWTTRGSLAGGTGEMLGLGLPVARSLATAAGGAVEIVASSPRGTTVQLRLPALPEDRAATEPANRTDRLDRPDRAT